MEFWINIWAAVVLIACLSMALCSSYSFLELASTVVLGGIVLCVGISVVLLGPNVLDLLAGLFVPQTPVYPDWLLISPQYQDEFSGRSPWLEVSVYLGAVGGGA